MADLSLAAPRQRFQILSQAKFLAGLAADPTFRECLDYALLQYCHNLNQSQTGGANEAAMHQYRLQGAQAFIHVLLTLHRLPPAPSKREDDNLDHKT